jgi:hypothetical protein
MLPLVLDYGGCLNTFLPMDLFLSNSTHIAQGQGYRVIFGNLLLHQWKVPLLLTMGTHQCPLVDKFYQVFDINSFIHTC